MRTVSVFLKVCPGHVIDNILFLKDYVIKILLDFWGTFRCYGFKQLIWIIC